MGNFNFNVVPFEVNGSNIMGMLWMYRDLYKGLFDRSSALDNVGRLESKKKQLEHKNHFGFMAVIGRTPVGYVVCGLRGNDFWVNELCVNKHFRRFGIGTKLLSGIAKEACVRGGWGICLHLPPRGSEAYSKAKEFYLKLGFEPRAGARCEADKMILKGRRLRELVYS